MAPCLAKWALTGDFLSMQTAPRGSVSTRATVRDRLQQVIAVVRRIIGVPDYNEYLAHMQRQFPDCTHDHEPGCVVFDAVEAGEIAASRYASYVEMLDELRKVPVDDDEDEAGGGD